MSSQLVNIVIIVIIILAVWWLLKGTWEGYGQDASIRAAAGWISGPNYGFDPRQIFADQIQEGVDYERKLRGMNNKEGYTRENGADKNCKSCMSTEEFNLSN